MSKFGDKIFVRGNHTCPWWFCFTFDNPIRKLLQNPEKILSHYIKPGYRILDIGPGQGYFTFPLAKMIGEDGKVVALDIQNKMLQIIAKKAKKAGLENIKTKLYDGLVFDIDENFEFINIFWMFHEVEKKDNFIKQIKQVCKKNTILFFSEPYIHVTRNGFRRAIEMFEKNGFELIDQPKVFFSRTAVFQI